MKLQRLTLEELKRIYDTQLREAFPPAERKPYSTMEELYRAGRYFPYGLKDPNGRVIGYALLWGEPGGRYQLLDYLGVDPERRNEGLGGKILQRLRKALSGLNGILLEVEAPDGGREDKLRLRRLEFYRRNDCRLLPYDCALFGVHYRTLVLPVSGSEAAEELFRFHRRIYQNSFTPEQYQSYVEIPLPAGQKPRNRVSWADLKT